MRVQHRAQASGRPRRRRFARASGWLAAAVSASSARTRGWRRQPAGARGTELRRYRRLRRRRRSWRVPQQPPWNASPCAKPTHPRSQRPGPRVGRAPLCGGCGSTPQSRSRGGRRRWRARGIPTVDLPTNPALSCPDQAGGPRYAKRPTGSPRRPGRRLSPMPGPTWARGRNRRGPVWRGRPWPMESAPGCRGFPARNSPRKRRQRPCLGKSYAQRSTWCCSRA